MSDRVKIQKVSKTGKRPHRKKQRVPKLSVATGGARSAGAAPGKATPTGKLFPSNVQTSPKVQTMENREKIPQIWSHGLPVGMDMWVCQVAGVVNIECEPDGPKNYDREWMKYVDLTTIPGSEVASRFRSILIWELSADAQEPFEDQMRAQYPDHKWERWIHKQDVTACGMWPDDDLVGDCLDLEVLFQVSRAVGGDLDVRKLFSAMLVVLVNEMAKRETSDEAGVPLGLRCAIKQAMDDALSPTQLARVRALFSKAVSKITARAHELRAQYAGPKADRIAVTAVIG